MAVDSNAQDRHAVNLGARRITIGAGRHAYVAVDVGGHLVGQLGVLPSLAERHRTVQHLATHPTG